MYSLAAAMHPVWRASAAMYPLAATMRPGWRASSAATVQPLLMSGQGLFISDIEKFIRDLPKIELHIHLEGSIRPDTLFRLAKRNGIDLGYDDASLFHARYPCRNFQQFAALFGAGENVLCEPEDFALITEELGREAAQQGTRYLEITVSAGTHHRFKGIPFDELMDALAEGAAGARREVGVEMRFILDHVRGFPLEDCQRTAEWCVRGRDRGVVALGLGGYEPGYPASLYSEAIRWAQTRGMPFIPHAGEATGPEGIWDALQFHPPRIGHGFRAIEDPALLRYLRDQGTALEICPMSNVCLGHVASLEAHPLRRLWDAGVVITLNSDDPTLFSTTLVNEYRLAITRFGFTPAELAQVSFAALRVALAPPEVLESIIAAFQKVLASYQLNYKSLIADASGGTIC